MSTMGLRWLDPGLKSTRASPHLKREQKKRLDHKGASMQGAEFQRALQRHSAAEGVGEAACFRDACMKKAESHVEVLFERSEIRDPVHQRDSGRIFDDVLDIKA